MTTQKNKTQQSVFSPAWCKSWAPTLDLHLYQIHQSAPSWSRPGRTLCLEASLTETHAPSPACVQKRLLYFKSFSQRRWFEQISLCLSLPCDEWIALRWTFICSFTFLSGRLSSGSLGCVNLCRPGFTFRAANRSFLRRLGGKTVMEAQPEVHSVEPAERRWWRSCSSRDALMETSCLLQFFWNLFFCGISQQWTEPPAPPLPCRLDQ